jgi:Domain of unknown function (DUF4407)
MQSLLGIATYLLGHAKSIVESFISDAIKFFQLLPYDSSGAAQYAFQAFVGLFVLFLLGKYFYKFSLKLDGIAKGIGSFVIWLKDAIASQSKYSARLVGIVVKKLIRAIFKLNTYNRTANWVCMLPANVVSRYRRGYQNGEEFMMSQRNLGIAAVLVSIWSCGALGVAVFLGLSNSPLINSSVAIVMSASMAIVYGLLVLSLERSIIATSPKQSSGLEQLQKVALRICLSVLVAHFSALPLTILILGKGIAKEIDTLNAESEASRSNLLAAVSQAELNAIAQKRTSTSCLNATTSLNKFDGLIQREANNCLNPSSRNPCVGEKTIYLQSQRESYDTSVKLACNLTKVEVEAFSQQRQDINAAQTMIISKDVDILVGYEMLERIKRKFSSFTNPINVTFLLLLGVDLIVVFIKLWQAQPHNRREKSDRRIKSIAIAFSDRRLALRR